MQLVESNHPISGNGLCFICEQQCDRRFGVVNTRVPFDPDFHHPLVGMKYVCEHCVRAMADLFGLGDVTAPQEKIVEVDKTAEFVKTIQKDLAALRKEVAVPKAGKAT